MLIAKALVDYPEQVSVREVVGNYTNVWEIEVAKVDIGKVVGRRGRNVQAIRTILGAACAKENKRMVLEIVD
jgi:predicted RNA-binding protein YlqC (UPF0109 family)